MQGGHEAVSEPEAVVYDLDGTLVRLAVDWDQVRTEAAAVLCDHGLDPGDDTLWELLERAEAADSAARVLEVIAAHERRGARDSRQLATATELPRPVPVAVCSLNCEAACRTALETHDLAGHVDAVVGRDTVSEHKPAPEPLLAALDRLGVSPEAAVFVGDTETDATTAAEAGVSFRWVNAS